MQLSIVTICRNDAAGLRRTLESTFGAQPGFDDWEQIVVDGASTDGSFAEVDRHRNDPHLGWCVSEPDGGIYNAMNKGAAHARGEYLLFLNAGDVLKPGVLKDVFADHFSEDILYGDVDASIDGEAKPRSSPEAEELSPVWFLFSTLQHQGCFIRRDLHERIGGYDETFRISADHKFLFVAAAEQHATFRHLPLRVAEFDKSGVSSDPKNLGRRMEEWERFLVPRFGDRLVAEVVRGKINRRLVRSSVTDLARTDWKAGEEIRETIDWALKLPKKRGLPFPEIRETADWALKLPRKSGLPLSEIRETVDWALKLSRKSGLPFSEIRAEVAWLLGQRKARGATFDETRQGAELFLDLRNTWKGRLLLRILCRLCGRKPPGPSGGS